MTFLFLALMIAAGGGTASYLVRRDRRRAADRAAADKKDGDTVREAFDEAKRLLCGDPDDDLAALAVYVPSVWSPEVRDLLTRLARLDRQT